MSVPQLIFQVNTISISQLGPLPVREVPPLVVAVVLTPTHRLLLPVKGEKHSREWIMGGELLGATRL